MRTISTRRRAVCQGLVAIAACVAAAVSAATSSKLTLFPVLYLEEGRWDGTQLLPASWVRESVRPHTSRPREADYGYLWWSQEPLESKGETEGVFMALHLLMDAAPRASPTTPGQVKP